MKGWSVGWRLRAESVMVIKLQVFGVVILHQTNLSSLTFPARDAPTSPALVRTLATLIW
jgi:hypothetical protein